MEPEQGGGRLGWDPTTTAQSWGRGATGPHPQPSGEPTGASPEQHVAQPHLGKPGSPHKHAPWVPTAFQGSRGSHGRAGRSLEALERVQHALRARGAPKGQGSQPPPPGPFPQPQSAHVYQAPPVPTGRGGAGSDIKGLSHNHRCLPHPDPQWPGRDSLLAAETAEHRWVGPIWGAQAAGPQLWTSSPGTQLASPGLCPQGKQAEGWAAPPPALSSHLHPSFTLRHCQTMLPASSSQ